MPLNQTNEEVAQKAIDELAFKVRLESQFKRDLIRFFRRMSADLRDTLANTGGSISAESYQRELQRMLSVHYRRVERAFTSEITNFIRDNINNVDELIIQDLQKIANARNKTIRQLLNDMRNNIKFDLQQFNNVNVAQDTINITRTNQKEIDRAILKAENQLKEEIGDMFSNTQLARLSSANLTNANLSRVGTIAATTTQKIAEGTKQIERDNFLEVVNSVNARQAGVEPRQPEEIWVTQGDDLVRAGKGTPFNHRAADFTKKENGVFIVSNETLRFPGDSSLGASLGNIINCRCSAVTRIE